MFSPVPSNWERIYSVKQRHHHGCANTPGFPGYGIVTEDDQTSNLFPCPTSNLTVCHSNPTDLLFVPQNTRPSKNLGSIKELCLILYHQLFWASWPLSSLGIFFHFVLLRTDFDLREYLLLLSIHSVCYQWKVTVETLHMDCLWPKNKK